MKYAHLIKLTVFSYENEISQDVLDAFLMFFPFNLEDNKIAFRKTNAHGFNESKIKIFEATLTKANLIKQFLNNLLKNLDETQKNTILQQVESRLDKNLDFFLRFDKDLWINENKLILTDSGRCFHLRISVAAFPKKREIALSIVRSLFSEK
ncbi:hypothetical protein HYX05_03275 [Candidatus Woesearchaeota archaeon]|nr:hypothetical protein [Candidatus Woesearchaeota archaeon]